MLRARARPTGVVRVELDLAARDGGTEVVMTEVPVEGPPALLHNPLQDWLIDLPQPRDATPPQAT